MVISECELFYIALYFNSVFVGGVLLALIEGVGILITRWSADQFKMGMSNFELGTYMVST